MAKKMIMPAAWAQDVECWLETLKAAGFSPDTVRSRRYKIARLCRELPSPMETTGEQITRVFADHDWKPETRKGYRNTIAGFYRWFHESGRRDDNPTAKVPKVKKPQAARIQFVSATLVFGWLVFDITLPSSRYQTSLGVSQSRTFMGVSLISSTMACRSSSVRSSKLVLLGR